MGVTSVRSAAMMVITVAILAFLVLMWYGLVRASAGGKPAGVVVNEEGKLAATRLRDAPDITLSLFDGGSFRFGEHRGQVVVVNFWASWCPPCRAEAPVLESVYRQYKDRGEVFLGVNLWDKDADARQFLQEFGITYPNGLDVRGKMAVEYGVTGIPETYIVDASGQVVGRWIGPITAAQLSQFIEQASKPGL